MRRLGSWHELLAVAISLPAPSLHTGHRHLQPPAGRDQSGHVKRAVLLRAQHLLPLIDQHRDVKRIADHQRVDVSTTLKLLDRRAAADRVAERDVGHGARPIGDDREHRERAHDIGRLDHEGASQLVSERRGGIIDCSHTGLFGPGTDDPRSRNAAAI